jgi:YVTN family beta-propeller protein
MKVRNFFSIHVWMVAVLALCAGLFAPSQAAANALNRVYVVNSGDHTITVIDTTSNNVVDTIHDIQNPGEIAVSPDGTKLYVLSFSTDTPSKLYIVDTSTDTITATVAVGREPFDVVVSPDNAYAYVLNRNDKTVSVIDSVTTSIIATVPVGSDPESIAISPDGKYVYTGNNDNTISIVDTSINVVTATFNVGSSINKIAPSPDGKYLYIANKGNRVLTVDTATNSVIATVQVGLAPQGIAVTPDSKYVYVGTYDQVSYINIVYVIDTATNTVSSTIATDQAVNTLGPHGLVITPDGKQAYVANYGANTVSVISTATNTVTSTFATGIHPNSVATQPAPSTVPPSAHTLTFYLHGNDVSETAGGYTMNQTEAAPDTLNLSLRSAPKWFSDSKLTGTVRSGGAFKLTLPCTQGSWTSVHYSLAKTNSGGGSVDTLGEVSRVFSGCDGTQTITIPVRTPVSFKNERLRLTISSQIGSSLHLEVGPGTNLQITNFTGTPECRKDEHHGHFHNGRW